MTLVHKIMIVVSSFNERKLFRYKASYFFDICKLYSTKFFFMKGTLCVLSAIFQKGDNFYDPPVCFPAQKIPSEKASTLKGKYLLPLGAKSFLLG